MKTYGIILAAGKQSRFNDDIPKALVEYNGKILLQHNYETLKNHCEKIYVVTSLENNHFFKDFLDKNDLPNLEIISIESGLGDGDAVLKTLNKIEFSDRDYFVLCWGDSIQENYYIEGAKYYAYSHPMVVPVHWEKNPYVLFRTDHQNKIEKVLFSKYNEINSEDGWHDLSVFIFMGSVIKLKLEAMREKFYNDENKNYDCRKGELVFLDLFNQNNFDNKIAVVKLKDDCLINSFNTIEEYKKIIDGK
jgi:NDP-sugar pyrophosphorylase family protein